MLHNLCNDNRYFKAALTQIPETVKYLRLSSYNFLCRHFFIIVLKVINEKTVRAVKIYLKVQETWGPCVCFPPPLLWLALKVMFQVGKEHKNTQEICNCGFILDSCLQLCKWTLNKKPLRKQICLRTGLPDISNTTLLGKLLFWYNMTFSMCLNLLMNKELWNCVLIFDLETFCNPFCNFITLKALYTP